MKTLRLATVALGILLLVAVLATGCATPSQPQEGVNTSPQQSAVQYRAVDTSNPRAKLVLASDGLIGYVVIINPKFRDVGKLTQAQVTVQNLTENRYTVEYKFDWEDAQGFKIEGPAVWRTLTLTPHLLTNLSSTGKTPDAKNIIFTVRFPDHVFIEQNKQMQREGR